MKKIAIMFIIILTIMSFNINVYASGFLGDVFNGGSGFLTSAKNQAASTNQASLAPVIKGLAQAALAVGTIIAIAAGLVIAMKFITDGANGKAEMKQALTPYIIGLCILFGGYGIWAAIMAIFDQF